MSEPTRPPSTEPSGPDGHGGAPPARGTRKRLEHIDAMRPVKQAAVVSTHALVFFAPLTSSTVIGLLMLTRFSRDAFLFVSACMLAYSYKDAVSIKLGTYFRKRFVSVGLPYLVWTVIYYLFTIANPVKSFPFYTLHGSGVFSMAGFHYLLHLVLTGYYHLYYLLVIMEFYVLFPLMLMALRRFARWHTWIFVGSLIWQLAYGVVLATHPWGLHITGFWQSRLITSYPIYVIGGVIVALHLEAVHDWIKEHARLIVSLTFAGAAAGAALSYLAREAWLPSYLHTGSNVFSAAIVPYNVGAILCVYLLGVFLVSEKRSARTRAVVQSGSDNSYGVYLSQMLWIPFLVRVHVRFVPHLAWPFAAPLALILTYFAGFIFTALFARTPLAKAVTGRSRATWSSLRPRRFFSGDEQTLRPDEGPLDVATF